jgi:hypothetical protein
MQRLIFAMIASLMLAAPAYAATLFITCDNGLRCVRLPCPSKDTVLLPAGTRLKGVTPGLDEMSSRDRRRLAESDGLYYGTVVMEGRVTQGSVMARRVVRNATPRETRLCRSSR